MTMAVNIGAVVVLFVHIGAGYVNAKSFNLPKPIDLSYALEENRLNWVQDAKFMLFGKVVFDEPPIFYVANNFTGPEHGGTHIDAPYHFAKNGLKTSEIPLDKLISTGIMVDVRDKVQNNADFLLLPEHLEEWERKHGSIPNEVIVLVNFGWASKRNDRVAYYGNLTTPYRFPGLSEEAAKWIVKSGKVNGVGVDTASIDSGRNEDYPVHKILLGYGIYGLENVALHGVELPPKGFDILALPMKIADGTGGACRIVAV